MRARLITASPNTYISYIHTYISYQYISYIHTYISYISYIHIIHTYHTYISYIYILSIHILSIHIIHILSVYLINQLFRFCPISKTTIKLYLNSCTKNVYLVNIFLYSIALKYLVNPPILPIRLVFLV